MAGKFSLKDLGKSVKAAGTDEQKIVVAKHRRGTMERVLTARLVANEFLRNGLNLKQAYEDVTRKKYTPTRFNAMISTDNAFMDEVNLALQAADVEKNKVLALLWAQATTSPLDFMDDNGVILPVAELKKLPRVLQALIEEVKVTTVHVPVKDEHGKVMKDENGKPYLRPEQHVHLKFPSKQAALTTIAQIGRLIGPQVLNQVNNFNIGTLMTEADNRRMRQFRERGVEVVDGVVVTRDDPTQS